MSDTLLKPPRHYRAKKARGVQLGDADLVAEAEIGMRAAKAAKAIKAATSGTPPLPPEVIDALRQLLPPTPCGA